MDTLLNVADEKKRTKICNRHMLEVFMLACFKCLAELLKFGGEETDPMAES